MIIKELDPFSSDDKFAKSGRAAEENMAFYLRRFYQDDPTIYVLNGIRLEENNDAAQIDHLIIHPNGMIVVECKSVLGKLQLKEDGQWVRWYGNQSKGMGSPIKQAEMQITFLRKFLNNKTTNNHNFFDNLPIEILIAISNDGIFIPPKNNPNAAPEVCKMDMVNERIDKILERSKGQILTDRNMSLISEFLVAINKPLIKTPVPIIVPAIEPIKAAEEPSTYEITEQNKCKHCGSEHLEVNFGRSYYFRCLDCDKNTSIVNKCNICNRTEKIRKEKNKFYTECQHCNTSRLFYTNA